MGLPRRLRASDRHRARRRRPHLVRGRMGSTVGAGAERSRERAAEAGRGMSRRQTAIVVTTIFEPKWLQGYLDNLRAHGREQDTSISIIIDRKTPPTVAQAAQAAVRSGFKVSCPTLDEQVAYLARLGLADDFVPWNTDNRRNIGFLMALEQGCDRLISIDDDNYCLPD